jgi:putative endonuclease
MWFVYILLCSDGSLYTGISDDPVRRLSDHKAGKGSRYTRSHPPIRIVYTESCGSKSDALKREAEIKRWPKAEKISLLKLHLK